jgi:transcriptional regulator of met regulon
MSKETQRLRSLAGRLSEVSISEKRKDVSLISVPMDANAPHGERGDFLKVTATLSPEVYKLVSDEVQRRKLAREPNAQMSAILREAVLAYLTPARKA